MPPLFEQEQQVKRPSFADVIANIQSEATPFTSMVKKRTRPSQVLQTWQAEGYPETGHAGVMDGQDATSFDSINRDPIQCNGQKTWRKPGVSDFADEAEIVGLNKGEMANQIAKSMVICKRQIEKRCLSTSDTASDDGAAQANETRGLLSWTQNAAQGKYPVPAQYRTPLAQQYDTTLDATKTLARFGEEVFLTMCRSSFKQRKGAFTMHAFVGIDLKAAFTNFTKYVDNVANKTPIRQFHGNADDQTYVYTIDQLSLDTGTVHLHPSSFLATDAKTGADTAFTHTSGVFVDMDMIGLAYTRMPRVVKLQYQGGGQKAIVDAIFLNMMDNPLGALRIYIDSTK